MKCCFYATPHIFFLSVCNSNHNCITVGMSLLKQEFCVWDTRLSLICSPAGWGPQGATHHCPVEQTLERGYTLSRFLLTPRTLPLSRCSFKKPSFLLPTSCLLISHATLCSIIIFLLEIIFTIWMNSKELLFLVWLQMGTDSRHIASFSTCTCVKSAESLMLAAKDYMLTWKHTMGRRAFSRCALSAWNLLFWWLNIFAGIGNQPNANTSVTSAQKSMADHQL